MNGNGMLIPAYKENNTALVFCLDEDFVPYFDIALRSLFKFVSTSRNYDIVIFYQLLNEDIIEYFLNMRPSVPNISLRFLDISPAARKNELEKWTDFRNLRFSETALFRLLIPDVMANYDKVLYLDGDILVRSDVGELWDMDLGDNLIAAIRRITDKYMENNLLEHITVNLKIADLNKYINSGVILFNVAKMKEEGTMTAFIEAAKLEFLIDCDQDVLNIVCKDRIRYLGDEWNAQWSVWFLPELTSTPRNEVKAILDNAKVMHYTSRKPSQSIERATSKYGIEWWEYARQSPYYEKLLAELIWKSRIRKKKGLFRTLQESAYKLIRR